MRKHDGGLPTCCHAPAQGAQALTRMGAGMDGGGASAMGLTSAKRLSAVTGTGDAKLGLGRPKGIEACVCSLGSTACSSMPHACKREATASLLIASRCQGPHSLQQAHQVSQQAIARYANALDVRRFSRAVSGLPCHHTALLASLLCSQSQLLSSLCASGCSC